MIFVCRYAVEPYCNFRSHSQSNQGAVIVRNIFDERVAPSAGIGRTGVTVFNTNLSDTGGNSSGLEFDFNIYSLSGRISAKRAFPLPTHSASGRSGSFLEWQALGNDKHGSLGSPGFPTKPNASLGIRRELVYNNDDR